MSRYTVRIPIERMTAINANDRLHYMRRAARVRDIRGRGRLFARSAMLPKLVRAQIDVDVARPTFAGDAANWHPTVKPLVDGFIDYGLLPDDRDRYLRGPFLHPSSRRSRRGVVEFDFTITDLGGDEP